MNGEKVLITKEGFEKLKTELEYLKTQKRAEAAEKLRIARGFGDLSENAEYDHAKNEQAKVEEKIAKLENMLRNAVLIEEENLDKNHVSIGTKVTIREKGTKEDELYTIVGSAETDPLAGKISNESPMGSALLGKKIGDKAQVETPAGLIEFEIVAIETM